MSSIVASRPTFLCLLPLAVFSMLAACSSAPMTPGDYALAQGKKWNKGTEMVQDGQSLIKKGNGQIEDGNANIVKGKSLIAKGKSTVAEAEAAMKAQQIQSPAAK